jgi:hypothetical protein
MRKSDMRSALIVLLIGLGSTPCLGQQSGNTTVTVSGCVVGMNGSFKLTTHDGERYVLKGDHSTLFTYNGTVVEVTGTVKAPAKSSAQVKPTTLHVTGVKKLADTCQ